MFFEEGNCRTVRLLHKASHFLEDCLEKLFVLEQEALSDLKNETIRNKNKSRNSVNKSSKKIEDEWININCMPGMSSAISNQIDSAYLNNTEHLEHKSICESKKISMLDLEKLSCIIPETSSKRKLEVLPTNENSKRSKCDQMNHLSDEEIPENYIIHKKQSNFKSGHKTLEQTSESSIQNIKSEDDLEEPVLNSKQVYWLIQHGINAKFIKLLFEYGFRGPT